MAKAAVKTDFRSILASVRKGEFAPVYLLMGEETYYIDKIVEAIETNVVAEDEKDFNFSTYYGQDAVLADVIATCQQYPFMAERRAVILKEAQSVHGGKPTLDQLAPYVGRPNADCVFVLVYKGDNLNATSSLMRTAAKSGAVVFKSPALRDYELSAPIINYCREKKVGIGEDCVGLLTEYIGNSLSKLFGAIDKLIIAEASKTGRITPDMIERNIGISKDYNNFELQTAIASKDFDKCMRIVKYFEGNPSKNPTVLTTGLLFGFFSKLLAAQMSADKSPAGLKRAVGAKSDYAFRDYGTALRNYTPAQTVNAIHQLRAFDTKSKGVGSFQNEYALLKEMIFNIFASVG